VTTSRRGLILVLTLWLLAIASSGFAADQGSSKADLEVFTRSGCPHCAAAKRFLDELQRSRPNLRILIWDIGEDPAALARLKDAAAAQGLRAIGVPAFYVRGRLLIGFAGPDRTGRQILALLNQPESTLAGPAPEEACRPEPTIPCDRTATEPQPGPDGITLPFVGRVTVQGLGLPLFTLILGLLDGFNPCSMWVLVFMLSLLAGLRDRVKLLVIAGTFVAVQGLVYFAFMAAWLNVFLFVGLSRAAEILLGTIAGLAGVVHVKDFLAFGRGLSLSVPSSTKPTLYAKVRRILYAEHLAGALLGTVVLAVLVQGVEVLCTAGLPALYTGILTMHQLEGWLYYGYLLLYNAAYMFDDVIVLGIGAVTLSRRRLQEREGRWLKLVSGLVMVGLGIVLIAKPEWLAW
jgi:glutaredoxin